MLDWLLGVLMARIKCPKCSHRFDASHSTFHTGRSTVNEEFTPGDYHPDPEKEYKTPEKTRRVSSAWYWTHRTAVQMREKRRRQQQTGKVSVSVND
mgnify:CR=1 FL=1